MPLDPSKPGACFLSCTNSGWASLPLTSIFLNSGKLTPKFNSQNSEIAPSLPGSCLPNWLQGNPSTTSPWSLYCCQSCSRPLYCGVKPHLLAVLTTKMALPAKSAKVFCSPLIVVHGMLSRLVLMAVPQTGGRPGKIVGNSIVCNLIDRIDEALFAHINPFIHARYNSGSGLLANAVCQPAHWSLTHCIREQARSHIWRVLPALARDKVQAHRDDAVPQTRRRRAIREHMPQVRIEARPAATRIKLGAGIEQRLIATDAVIHTVGLGFVVFAAERALGALETTHLILRGVEHVPPLIQGFLQLIHQSTSATEKA